MPVPKPVTVSVDVPQPRADVYAFLDVMANHEQFTDHMLTDWRLEGPPSGVGSAVTVSTGAGLAKDEARIEVFDAVAGQRIAERNVSAKGKRVATGTYVLNDAPGGGTHVEFTFAWETAPLADRLGGPLVRSVIRRGNEQAMARLKDVLAQRDAAGTGAG